MEVIPAPGGPIKTIRTDSVFVFVFRAIGPPSLFCSFSSNCSTRDSSLCMRSLSASTVSSLIGPIATLNCATIDLTKVFDVYKGSAGGGEVVD